MRRIIAGMFITLDGVVESPEKWNPRFYNHEMTDAVQGQMARCDTHLYGRRSYELFRSVFTGPAAERIPHAPLMNQTPKVVVSTTLEDADWGPVTVITGDVATKLAQLKGESGKHINVGASGTLVRFLLKKGLLDELQLLIHPLVLGQGRRLFEPDGHRVPLELLESKTFSTGVVLARYRPSQTS